MGSLTPIIYWAQTADVVTLKIDLKDVKDHVSKTLEDEYRFSAKGVGAHGLRDYAFNLKLYSQVESDSTVPSCKVVDSKVEVLLRKIKPAWWPRLIAQPQKPGWLKIDFDRWKSEEGDSEEERRDIMNDYPGMYDKLHKEEMGYRKEDIKKVYLIFYNMFQFVGFTYILCVMGVRYSKFGLESMESTYEYVGSAMKFLQLLQFLEVLHPLFGYTRGGVVQPFIQVTGRALILFAMIESEPRMQIKPVVFYLFFVWSAVEIVRYPYYISQLYKKDFFLLTWLRYTIWIPLYPLGVLCEGVVVLRNIPYFEETKRFTVSLPNSWNFAFHTPTCMRIYLLLLLLPGLYAMMRHMYRARITKMASYKKQTRKNDCLNVSFFKIHWDNYLLCSLCVVLGIPVLFSYIFAEQE